jgi:hypothetical protein
LLFGLYVPTPIVIDYHTLKPIASVADRFLSLDSQLGHPTPVDAEVETADEKKKKTVKNKKPPIVYQTIGGST